MHLRASMYLCMSLHVRICTSPCLLLCPVICWHSMPSHQVRWHRRTSYDILVAWLPSMHTCPKLTRLHRGPEQPHSPSAAGQCHARPPQPTQPARRVHARWAPHWVQPHVADILNTYVHARHRPARGHLAWAGTPACVRDHLICMESNKGRSGN